MTFVYDHPTSQHNQAAPAEKSAPQPEGLFEYPEAARQQEVPQATPLDQLSPELREVRADPDRQRFSPQRLHAQDIPDHPTDGEGEKFLRAEFREQAADLDLGGVEIRQLTGIINDELRDGIPDQAKVDAWTRESLEAIHREFGKAADTRIAEARRLVARDSQLKALLDRSGLGSHPTVVRMLIDKARSQRLSGKLK